MTDKEAMQIALDALEQWNTPLYKRTNVLDALRTALAQPDTQIGITYEEANPPQPYCKRCGKKLGTEVTDIHTCTPKKLINVNGVLEQAGYAKKKEWVGLTDDDVNYAVDAVFKGFDMKPRNDTEIEYLERVIKFVEAKLKDKNI